MKILFIMLMAFLWQNSFAQKQDTIWYNNKWEKTSDIKARHYSRIVNKLPDGYKVKDFYETGSLQMEGIYSSLDPDIKNGEFKYWYRSGKNQMEVTYENNIAIQVCQYNEQGEITEEWERIAIVKYKNGNPATEYRVLQRSPKFPGGKVAMNEFIKKTINYPQHAANIMGTVVVQFKVNADGKVVDPVIINSLSAEHDREALNVIKKMPKWEPGKQDGKTVAITLSLPINFN